MIIKTQITEAVGGDNDCDGWNTIIDTYVLDLLKLRRMELLSAVNTHDHFEIFHCFRMD